MNLTDMRVRFKRRTSGLGDALSDAEIDVYLDRAYQFTVPVDVGGSYTQGTWALTSVPGQVQYAMPDYVISPSGIGVHILESVTGGSLGRIQWLDVETDSTVWNATDRAVPAGDRAIPTSVLIYGRNVFLDPRPDLDYVVNFPGQLGPSAGLTEDGLGQENYARAVVAAAAVEYLGDEEDIDGMQREQVSYGDYTYLMRTSAHGIAKHRRPMRSYK